MSKFTPGPWHAGRNRKKFLGTSADLPGIVYAKDGSYVADCYRPFDKGHESAPNAELIAVAPEMYAFIESCCAFNDEGANAYLKETGSYRCFDNPDVVKEARRIFAKVNHS